MPKRKRSTSSTTTTRSKKSRTKSPMYKAIVSKGELKFVDFDTTETSSSSSGTVHNLTTLLIRGAEAYKQFIGRYVRPQRMEVKYNINGCLDNITTGADAFNMTRCHILQWNDDGTPSVANIYSQTPYYLSPLQETNKDKIRTIRDFSVDTHFTAIDPDGPKHYSDSKSGKMNINLKSVRQIQFASGANVVQSGNLFLVVSSNSGLPPYPTHQFYVRLYYYDQ